jgi:hypothetical protein
MRDPAQHWWGGPKLTWWQSLIIVLLLGPVFVLLITPSCKGSNRRRHACEYALNKYSRTKDSLNLLHRFALL